MRISITCNENFEKFRKFQFYIDVKNERYIRNANSSILFKIHIITHSKLTLYYSNAWPSHHRGWKSRVWISRTSCSFFLVTCTDMRWISFFFSMPSPIGSHADFWHQILLLEMTRGYYLTSANPCFQVIAETVFIRIFSEIFLYVWTLSPHTLLETTGSDYFF